MAVTIGHRHPVRISTPLEVVIGAVLATAVALGAYFAISAWTESDSSPAVADTPPPTDSLRPAPQVAEVVRSTGVGHPLGTVNTAGTGHPLGTIELRAVGQQAGALFQQIGAASLVIDQAAPAVEDIYSQTGAASLISNELSGIVLPAVSSPNVGVVPTSAEEVAAWLGVTGQSVGVVSPAVAVPESGVGVVPTSAEEVAAWLGVAGYETIEWLGLAGSSAGIISQAEVVPAGSAVSPLSELEPGWAPNDALLAQILDPTPVVTVGGPR